MFVHDLALLVISRLMLYLIGFGVHYFLCCHAPVYFHHRKFCAQHRPLAITVSLGVSAPAFEAERALGAAYWRSDTARRRTLSIIGHLNDADPVTFDPVADYAALENAVQLGSKRNPRRPRSLPWEKFLNATSRATLDHQRTVVFDLEVLYENLQTSVIFRQLVAEKRDLERLTTRLMRVSLESQVDELSSRAQDHTQAWSVFSSMSATQASVPIPPSTLADHFETVMSPKSTPAAVILPEVPSVHGPLTESDADLCSAFSGEELNQAVRQINMSSAPGPDGVTPVMVRDLFTFRAFFLFFLMFVNFCFAMAWIPLAWRCSEIFILYKGKGDPTSPDSYRGIALCCILAKTYERLLLFRLMKWWEKSSVFKLTQFGFQSGSSTLDAVFVLSNLVNFVCRENRLPLHACFIDLRKAFPSVSRPALFQRLIRLGVPRPLVLAISSFYQLTTARL